MFVNVPALVSHQPTLPRDEPTQLPPADAASCPTPRVPDDLRLAPHFGLQFGVVECGGAKSEPPPWRGQGDALRDVGTDLSCLKRTSSGLSLGSLEILAAGALDEPQDLEVVLEGKRACLDVGVPCDLGGGGRVVDQCSRCSEEPIGPPSHDPNQESSPAYTSSSRQGSWLAGKMHSNVSSPCTRDGQESSSILTTVPSLSLGAKLD